MLEIILNEIEEAINEVMNEMEEKERSFSILKGYYSKDDEFKLKIVVRVETEPSLADLMRIKIIKRLKKYGRPILQDPNTITLITESGERYKIVCNISVE